MNSVKVFAVLCTLFGCSNKTLIRDEGELFSKEINEKIENLTLDECARMYKAALHREYGKYSEDERLSGATVDMVSAFCDNMSEIEHRFNKFYKNFDNFLGKYKEKYVTDFRKKLNLYIKAWREVINLSSNLVSVKTGGTISMIESSNMHMEMFFEFIYHVTNLIKQFCITGEGEYTSFRLYDLGSDNEIEYKTLKDELDALSVAVKKKCKREKDSFVFF